MAWLATLRARLRHRGDRLVCQRAVELMSDFLEGTLDERERARFERHLTTCPACTAYLAQMRATLATLGRLDPDALPAEVRQELIDLYRRHRAG